MVRTREFCIALLILFAVDGHGESFASTTTAPVIIELYTSEGCSSCPPAERWLNQLADSEQLWSRYFAIAWHVDYWDSLGWPDRFARPQYSQRQWLYQKQTPLKSVYTPGVLVNGRAWRGWRAGRLPPANTGPAVGELRVELTEWHFQAQFSALDTDPAGRLELHAALLGFGLSTRVERGENAGRRLRHDFVVLAHEAFGRAGDHWSGELPPLPEPAAGPTKLAVVFWLQRSGSPQPLQMAGGWISR